MLPVWNYLGQTCGLRKLDRCYSFVVLGKDMEDGYGAKITRFHYNIGGFYYKESLSRGNDLP